MVESGWAEWVLTGSARILVLRKCRDFSVLRFGGMDFKTFLVGEIHQLKSQGVDCQTTTENRDARTFRRCTGVRCQVRLEWVMPEICMML